MKNRAKPAPEIYFAFTSSTGAAGEPPRANALRGLTYAYLPVGVYVYFRSLNRLLFTSNVNYFSYTPASIMIHKYGSDMSIFGYKGCYPILPTLSCTLIPGNLFILIRVSNRLNK
jgi:hypothetical protein